jgi:hypothetical protein
MRPDAVGHTQHEHAAAQRKGQGSFGDPGPDRFSPEPRRNGRANAGEPALSCAPEDIGHRLGHGERLAGRASGASGDVRRAQGLFCD